MRRVPRCSWRSCRRHSNKLTALREPSGRRSGTRSKTWCRVAASPGEEGKWFAAAKSAGLYREAIGLATSSPCDPGTLSRAARDLAATEPRFTVEAGLAALRWLAGGYGYEITNLDVRDVHRHTMQAATNAGCAEQALERIRALVAAEKRGDRFVGQALGLGS